MTTDIQRILEEFVEKGAALEHARWARWQEHMFDCAVKSGDDTIKYRTFGYPTEQVERWERQIETPYDQLSEAEKESDRKEVREYLSLLTSTLLAYGAAQRVEVRNEIPSNMRPHNHGCCQLWGGCTCVSCDCGKLYTEQKAARKEPAPLPDKEKP